MVFRLKIGLFSGLFVCFDIYLYVLTYGIHSTALDWLRSYMYLCDRRQTIIYDEVFSTALFAVTSLRAPYLGRCCSCSTPPTWVSLLPVSAYHPTSMPTTLSFTRGA